jgi:hypothetical protein
MAAARSGDVIKETVKTSSLVSTLLAPFVHVSVARIETYTGMELGDSYEAQVLMAVGGLIVWASTHYRMYRLKQDEASPFLSEP